MSEKNPVSILQEYAMRNKIPSPHYDTIAAEKGFCCKITLEGMEEIGMGRSKRDAKSKAAAALAKRMGMVKPLAADAISSVTDAITTLRNYCVKTSNPLPTIEIVQQSGTAHCPQFVAFGQVSTVKVYATSITKKDAKQKAATDLLKAITEPNLSTSAVASPPQINEKPEVHYNKYNNYLEVGSGQHGDYKPVPLADRHNYFTRFHTDLKHAAFRVLATNYDSAKEKAMDVLKALKLTATTEQRPSTGEEPMLIIDVDCDIDVVFMGTKHNIYHKMIEYFSEMLD